VAYLGISDVDPLTGKKKSQQDPFAAGLAASSYAPGVAPGNVASTLFGDPSQQQPQSGLPAGMPDYASLIANDPLFKQSQADMAAMGIQDEASRNAAINRAVVQFGATPDLAKAQQTLGLDLGSILNPDTQTWRGRTSIRRRRSWAARTRTRTGRSPACLAARGGLQSGDLGYYLQRNATSYGQAQNDATQKLLDFIGGVQSQYTTYQRQQQAIQRQAAADAAHAPRLRTRTRVAAVMVPVTGRRPTRRTRGRGRVVGSPLEQIRNEIGYYNPGNNGTAGQQQSARDALARLADALGPQHNAYNDNPNKRG
jgi:hypothetical protein